MSVLRVANYVTQVCARRVKTWWIKLYLGLLLLVPAAVLTKTFFAAFSRAAVERDLWLTEEVWFCGLGVALWTCWFFGSIWAYGRPEPVRAYVFGHELSHAVWVWLLGGRVSKIEHSADGGYILTNKSNFWIALAPYFYPIYTFAVIAVFAIIGIFYDLTSIHATFLWVPATQWIFLLIGLTWGFHFSFTCWMIPKGQSDLRSHGTFFSLVVIYLVNLALISVFLIVADEKITMRSFAKALLWNVETFSVWAASHMTAAFWGCVAWFTN